MTKIRIMGLLLCLCLLFGCAAAAEGTVIAPEVVAGKIMGYVINNEGAAVYDNIFDQGATMEPVETIEYGTEVEIQVLGLGYCRLRRESNDHLYVRTSDLSFSNEAFGDQLAVVFLKQSKYLPLHKNASAKSKRLTEVPDGTYVVILEKGETFSRVLYCKNGGRVYDGYLQNSYLSFRVAWQEQPGRVLLRDPKKPERHTTVNLRSSTSNKGRKVGVVATYDKTRKATMVLTLLRLRDDGWAEVETEKGLHGYLKADWVETLEPAEPAEEPEEEAVTEEIVTEDAELKEGEAMGETVPPDDEEEPVAAEELPLAPEWEEGEGT